MQPKRAPVALAAVPRRLAAAAVGRRLHGARCFLPLRAVAGSAPSSHSGAELAGVFSLFLFSAHSVKDKYRNFVQGLRTFYQHLLNSAMEKVVVAKVSV